MWEAGRLGILLNKLWPGAFIGERLAALFYSGESMAPSFIPFIHETLQAIWGPEEKTAILKSKTSEDVDKYTKNEQSQTNKLTLCLSCINNKIAHKLAAGY